jgi:hypothetical protein
MATHKRHAHHPDPSFGRHPGDTFDSIAARNHLSVPGVAWMNTA